MESIIHFSLHLTKIKLVLERMVKIVQWHPEELSSVEEYYLSAVGTIDSFGRERTVSPYDNRIFTPTGKLLVEISKGWPQELEYGWINRRVVSIFDVVDTTSDDKDIINIIFIFTDSIVIIKPTEPVSMTSESGIHKPSIADMLMHSMINSMPLINVPDLVVVGWAPIEDCYFATFGNPQNLSMYITGKGLKINTNSNNSSGGPTMAAPNFNMPYSKYNKHQNNINSSGSPSNSNNNNKYTHQKLFRLIRPGMDADTVINYVSKAKIMNKTQPFHLFQSQQPNLLTYATVHEYQGYRLESRKCPIAIFANMKISPALLDSYNLIACIGVQVYDENFLLLRLFTKFGYNTKKVIRKENFGAKLSSHIARIYSMFFSSSNSFSTESIVQNNAEIAEFLVKFATTEKPPVTKPTKRHVSHGKSVKIAEQAATPQITQSPPLRGQQSTHNLRKQLSSVISTSSLRTQKSQQQLGTPEQESSRRFSLKKRISTASIISKISHRVSQDFLRTSSPKVHQQEAQISSPPSTNLASPTSPTFSQNASLSAPRRKSSFNFLRRNSDRKSPRIPQDQSPSLASSSARNSLTPSLDKTDSFSTHSLPLQQNTIDRSSASNLRHSYPIYEGSSPSTQEISNIHYQQQQSIRRKKSFLLSNDAVIPEEPFDFSETPETVPATNTTTTTTTPNLKHHSQYTSQLQPITSTSDIASLASSQLSHAVKDSERLQYIDPYAPMEPSLPQHSSLEPLTSSSERDSENEYQKKSVEDIEDGEDVRNFSRATGRSSMSGQSGARRFSQMSMDDSELAIPAFLPPPIAHSSFIYDDSVSVNNNNNNSKNAGTPNNGFDFGTHHNLVDNSNKPKINMLDTISSRSASSNDEVNYQQKCQSDKNEEFHFNLGHNTSRYRRQASTRSASISSSVGSNSMINCNTVNGHHRQTSSSFCGNHSYSVSVSTNGRSFITTSEEGTSSTFDNNSVREWYNDLHRRSLENGSLDSIDINFVPGIDSNETTFDDDDDLDELNDPIANITRFIDEPGFLTPTPRFAHPDNAQYMDSPHQVKKMASDDLDTPHSKALEIFSPTTEPLIMPASDMSRSGSHASVFLSDDFQYLANLVSVSDDLPSSNSGSESLIRSTSLYPDLRDSSLVFLGQFIHSNDQSNGSSHISLSNQLSSTQSFASLYNLQPPRPAMLGSLPPRSNNSSYHDNMNRIQAFIKKEDSVSSTNSLLNIPEMKAGGLNIFSASGDDYTNKLPPQSRFANAEDDEDIVDGYKPQVIKSEPGDNDAPLVSENFTVYYDDSCTSGASVDSFGSHSSNSTNEKESPELSQMAPSSAAATNNSQTRHATALAKIDSSAANFQFPAPTQKRSQEYIMNTFDSLTNLSTNEIELRSLILSIESLINEEFAAVMSASTTSTKPEAIDNLVIPPSPFNIKQRKTILGQLERINDTVFKLFESTRSLVPLDGELESKDAQRVVNVEKSNRSILMGCAWTLIGIMQRYKDKLDKLAATMESQQIKPPSNNFFTLNNISNHDVLNDTYLTPSPTTPLTPFLFISTPNTQNNNNDFNDKTCSSSFSSSPSSYTDKLSPSTKGTQLEISLTSAYETTLLMYNKYQDILNNFLKLEWTRRSAMREKLGNNKVPKNIWSV